MLIWRMAAREKRTVPHPSGVKSATTRPREGNAEF